MTTPVFTIRFVVSLAAILGLSAMISCGTTDPPPPDNTCVRVFEMGSAPGAVIAVELAPGDSTTLAAQVDPFCLATSTDLTVAWTSSDPAVATVDPASGKVTAVALGTAVITATSNADARLRGTANITVREEQAGAVRSVTVNPAAVTLGPGGATIAVVSIDADNAADTGLTLSTSDASVATVQEIETSFLAPEGMSVLIGGTGITDPKDPTQPTAFPGLPTAQGAPVIVVERFVRVSAVGVGSATITLTSAVDNTKSASISVTVLQDGGGLVRSVTVSPSTVTITAGQTRQLTETVDADENVSTRAEWTSLNTGVATVSSAGLVAGGHRRLDHRTGDISLGSHEVCRRSDQRGGR